MITHYSTIEKFNKQLEDDFYSISNKPRVSKETAYVVTNDNVEKVKRIIVDRFVYSETFNDNTPEVFDMLFKKIYETEKQKFNWLTRNSVRPLEVCSTHNPARMKTELVITASLTGPALTEWLLRHEKSTTNG